jgi:heme A synthase
MKAVLRWWTIVLPALVVVQIALVGVGAFHATHTIDDKFGDSVPPDCASSCGKTLNDSIGNWFGPHVAFGYILFLIALLYAIASLFSRDRRQMKIGGITAALFAVQVLLAWLGDGIPALGWLHPLNALLILGFTGRNGFLAWHARQDSSAVPATATA